MSKTGLNQKQRNYIDNLLRGMSQKKAYEEAGYKATGDSAKAGATRLMSKPKVIKELKRRRENRTRRTKSQLTTLLTRSLKTYKDILEKEDISEEERRQLKLKLDTAKDIFDRCNMGSPDTEINIENVQEENSRDKLKEIYQDLEKQEKKKEEKD